MRKNEGAAAFLEMYNTVGHYRLIARFYMAAAKTTKKGEQGRQRCADMCAITPLCKCAVVAAKHQLTGVREARGAVVRFVSLLSPGRGRE